MRTRCAAAKVDPIRRPGQGLSTAAAVACLIVCQCIAGPAVGEQLSAELSVGLPEPTAEQMADAEGLPFCPLGVCRPRSRDSLWAAGSFGLAALTSVWLGRRRSRNNP